MVIINILVDWNGRRVDSWGISVEVRPRRSRAPRRLAKRPPESEAPGVEINGFVYQNKKKTPNWSLIR